MAINTSTLIGWGLVAIILWFIYAKLKQKNSPAFEKIGGFFSKKKDKIDEAKEKTEQIWHDKVQMM